MQRNCILTVSLFAWTYFYRKSYTDASSRQGESSYERLESAIDSFVKLSKSLKQ